MIVAGKGKIPGDFPLVASSQLFVETTSSAPPDYLICDRRAGRRVVPASLIIFDVAR